MKNKRRTIEPRALATIKNRASKYLIAFHKGRLYPGWVWWWNMQRPGKQRWGCGGNGMLCRPSFPPSLSPILTPTRYPSSLLPSFPLPVLPCPSSPFYESPTIFPLFLPLISSVQFWNPSWYVHIVEYLRFLLLAAEHCQSLLCCLLSVYHQKQYTPQNKDNYNTSRNSTSSKNIINNVIFTNVRVTRSLLCPSIVVFNCVTSNYSKVAYDMYSTSVLCYVTYIHVYKACIPHI